MLFTREENRVQVFPSSLQVSSVQDAERRLARASVSEYYRSQLLTICQALFGADADEGISTDELMMATGLAPEGSTAGRLPPRTGRRNRRPAQRRSRKSRRS